MKMAPGDVVLPSNRLEHLLRQSLSHQEHQALYPYTKSTKLNLAEDLSFDETKLPYLCTEITYHSDEVWVCKFSPSGRWLATAGEADASKRDPCKPCPQPAWQRFLSFFVSRCSCPALLQAKSAVLISEGRTRTILVHPAKAVRCNTQARTV